MASIMEVMANLKLQSGIFLRDLVLVPRDEAPSKTSLSRVFIFFIYLFLGSSINTFCHKRPFNDINKLDVARNKTELDIRVCYQTLAV